MSGFFAPAVPPSIGGAITGGGDDRVIFVNPAGIIDDSASLKYDDSTKTLAIGGSPADLGLTGVIAEDASNAFVVAQIGSSGTDEYAFLSAGSASHSAAASFQANSTTPVQGALLYGNNADGDGAQLTCSDVGGTVGTAQIDLVPSVGITFRLRSGAGAPTLYWTIDRTGNINNQTASYVTLKALGADPSVPSGSDLKLYCKAVVGVGKLFYIDSAGLVTGPLT